MTTQIAGRRGQPIAARAAALLCGLVVLAASCVADGPAPSSSAPSRSESAASYNLQLGVAYLQQGNLALAKEKIDRAIKQNPRDATAQSTRALLAERLGDENEAERYYRAALRLAPDNPDVSNNFAVFLCRRGRVDEGVQRFTAAARNPLYATPEAAHTNAGVCLRGAGRLDEAAQSFARALQVRPNHVEAVLQLGELELTRGQAAQARAVVEPFVRAFRPTPDLLLLLARIAREQGDRVAEERYARQLRVEFPSAEQIRRLPRPAGAR